MDNFQIIEKSKEALGVETNYQLAKLIEGVTQQSIGQYQKSDRKSTSSIVLGAYLENGCSSDSYIIKAMQEYLDDVKMTLPEKLLKALIDRKRKEESPE